MRKRSFSFLMGIFLGLTAARAEEPVGGPDGMEQAALGLGQMFDGEEVNEFLAPHAAEVCKILAQPASEYMTRIWLSQFASGNEAQQARATASLISLGDQAASAVRAFRDAHADDAGLHARCEQVLAAQKKVTTPDTIPAFPSTPLVKFLLTVPELSEAQVQPLALYYRESVVAREDRLQLDSLTPEMLKTLLRQTAKMEKIERTIFSWLAREPEATFQRLALEMLEDEFETSYPLLLRCQSNLDEVLKLAASPAFADVMGEEEWRAMMEVIAESYLSSQKYVDVLDALPEIPAGFASNAHALMEDKHRRHVALGGWYQSRYPVPQGEGRALLREMIAEDISFYKWKDFLESRELDPIDALYLLSVYSWRVGDFGSPVVIQLRDVVDAVDDETLVNFLAGRKPNYFLLSLFAMRRPEIQDRIRLMIYEGVKEEFTQLRFHLASNCMQGFKDPICPPGMFDDEWLKLYEEFDDDPKYRSSNLFILFYHAPEYRITPEVLWEKYRIHEVELMERDPSFMSRIPGYLMEYGGPELRKEMLSRISKPGKADTEAAKAMQPSFKDTLKLDPAETEGLVSLQAGLFYEECLERTSRFPGKLFGSSFKSSQYQDVADYYAQNREGIGQALNEETLRPALLPLLAVCGMDDQVRRGDDGFLRDAVRSCIEAYPEPDGILLGGSFVAVQLGAEDAAVARAFAESLALPVAGYSSHWKILTLLGEEQKFLLPELIRMADREESAIFPMLAMIQIAAQDPQVQSRTEAALFEGEVHALACKVMEYLSWRDLAPGLEAFSDERIDWMLRFDDKDSLYNTRRFVDALPDADNILITQLLKPRLVEAAQIQDSFFKFYHLFSTPETQRLVVDEIFRLLASDVPAEQQYAVRELRNFKTFTPRQLRVLAMNINRFEVHQNAINIRPAFMNAIANAGGDASFLAREIRYYADKGDEHLRPVALRALAGITDDPEEWKSCFDQLMWTFRNENRWRSNQVRQISRMQGQPETVLPFLQEIILGYGSQKNSEEGFVKESLWGLPFQTSSVEVVMPLFRHVWEVGCKDTGHSDVLEAMFYTVWKDYPELIPRFREYMEQTPLRHRVYYGYRMMKTALTDHALSE